MEQTVEALSTRARWLGVTRALLFTLLWFVGLSFCDKICWMIVDALPSFFQGSEEASAEWVQRLARIGFFVWTVALFFLFERVLGRKRLRETALYSSRASRAFLLGLGIGSSLLIVTVTLLILLGLVAIYGIEGGVGAVASTLSLYALAMMATAVTEELALRGVLLEELRHALGKHTAVFISATIFGLLHLPYSIDYAVSAFIGGLMLGYLYLLFGLYCAIGMHFAWNWLGAIIFSSPVVRTALFSGLLAGHPHLAPDSEGMIGSLVVCTGLALLLLVKRRCLFAQDAVGS